MCPILHRKMLLATLWNTGARINEALALTRGFSLSPPYPFVQLATLKQTSGEIGRTAGRAQQAVKAHRLVPLSDHQYVQPAANDGGHPENSPRKTKQTHRQEWRKARIWDQNRTVRTAAKRWKPQRRPTGVTFSVPVTPYVPSLLRDAHAVCRHTTEGFAEPDGPPNRLARRKSIRRCLHLMLLRGIEFSFQMPEADAVAMLKGIFKYLGE